MKARTDGRQEESLLRRLVGEGGWDELVVRGSLDERNAVVFYVQEQRIVAVVAINRGKDVQRTMPLIKARVQIDPAKLWDENVDMRSLMPEARPVRTHQHRVMPHPVARSGEEAK